MHYVSQLINTYQQLNHLRNPSAKPPISVGQVHIICFRASPHDLVDEKPPHFMALWPNGWLFTTLHQNHGGFHSHGSPKCLVYVATSMVLKMYKVYEGFHSHGGTPIAGEFISWQIPSINGWFLGSTPMTTHGKLNWARSFLGTPIPLLKNPPKTIHNYKEFQDKRLKKQHL